MREWPVPLVDRVRIFAIEHRLQPALERRWHALDAAAAEAIAELAEELRLGENHLRDVLEWCEEIALRDKIGVAEILRSTEVRDARARDLGRNDAVKAVREALRRLRFPRLAAAEEDLARRVRALRLPHEVRVILPPNLQDGVLRVEIRAGALDALRGAVEALRASLGRPELGELFAVMNGEIADVDSREPKE